MIGPLKLMAKTASDKRIIISIELTTITLFLSIIPRIFDVGVREIYDFVPKLPFNSTAVLYTAVKL